MYHPSRYLSQMQTINYTRFVLEEVTCWKKNSNANRGAAPFLWIRHFVQAESSSAIVWIGCQTSLAVSGLAAYCSRVEI